MRWPIGVAVIVLVALGVGAWLHFVHDPAVRARAQLDHRDATVDSVVAAWQDSLTVAAQRDSARVADTTRLAAQVQELEARQPGVRAVTNLLVAAVPDTAARRQLTEALGAERAVADSLRAADSTWRGLQAEWLLERGKLLLAARAAIDSLVEIKAAWKQAAGGNHWGLGCAAGTGVSSKGWHPASITCGVVLRF